MSPFKIKTYRCPQAQHTGQSIRLSVQERISMFDHFIRFFGQFKQKYGNIELTSGTQTCQKYTSIGLSVQWVEDVDGKAPIVTFK